MFAGDFASDMVANGLRRDIAVLNSSLQSTANQLRIANSNVIEMNLANAGNLGVRYALAEQLSHADPDNPLLKDVSLVERIKAAAESAFKIAGNHFDAAREVGRTFKIPGREKPILQKTAELNPKDAMELERVKEAHASSLALRSALAEQLRKLDPDNPILKDLMLIERVRKGGVAAFRINGDNFDSARIAGETFRIPGR